MIDRRHLARERQPFPIHGRIGGNSPALLAHMKETAHGLWVELTREPVDSLATKLLDEVIAKILNDLAARELRAQVILYHAND